MTPSEREAITQEFDRAAEGFAARTAGRFAPLDVVTFSRAEPGATVLEVGGGAGNFLSLFEGHGRTLVNLDLTPKMLEISRRDHPGILTVLGDGGWLPLASGSIDLSTSAQALHHVRKPRPLIEEMGRVAGPDGRVLVVDQCATERYEEAVAMNELETVRDPSHAASRPPSAFRTLLSAAGLKVEDEKIVEVPERFSEWMGPGEFPQQRIDAVLDFIGAKGMETGMDFRVEGGEWVFTRRRMMLLARIARG